jgi:hypothetical protein
MLQSVSRTTPRPRSALPVQSRTNSLSGSLNLDCALARRDRRCLPSSPAWSVAWLVTAAPRASPLGHCGQQHCVPRIRGTPNCTASGNATRAARPCASVCTWRAACHSLHTRKRAKSGGHLVRNRVFVVYYSKPIDVMAWVPAPVSLKEVASPKPVLQYFGLGLQRQQFTVQALFVLTGTGIMAVWRRAATRRTRRRPCDRAQNLRCACCDRMQSASNALHFQALAVWVWALHARVARCAKFSRK